MGTLHAIISESKNRTRCLVRFEPFSKVGLDILRSKWPNDGATRFWDHEENGWSMEITEAKAIRDALDREGTVQLDDGIAKLLATRRPPPVFEEVDHVFKTKPYDHQRRGFHAARRAKVFGLLFEMGCGKTKTFIDAASYKIANNELDAILIVSPKSMLYGWKTEIETHSSLPPERRRTVVVDGASKAEKRRVLEMAGDSATFIIVGYETVRDYQAQLIQICKRRRFGACLDEATKIKNHTSKRSKAIRDMKLLFDWRVIMTGTPVANRPLDIWAPFDFLDTNILGHTTFTSFKGEYAKVLVKPGHQLSGILVTGYKNLSRLHDRIAPHSLRVLKKECLDLPEKLYRTVELEMSDQQASFYAQMKEQSLIELTHLKNACDCHQEPHTDLCASARPVVLAAPHILTRTMRLQQLTGGFYPVMDATGHPDSYEFFAENHKAEAALEILEEAFEAEHKAIVWCKFTPEIDMWCRMLGEAKIGTVVLSGQTSTKDRAERIMAFQEMPHDKCAVFLGQIEAGGTGITLTRATKVLYYSNSLSLESRLQSEDRAHRIGQRQDVEYIDFAYHKTVDMAIRKAMREKKEFADIVTGDNLRRAFEGEL